MAFKLIKYKIILFKTQKVIDHLKSYSITIKINFLYRKRNCLINFSKISLEIHKICDQHN